MHGHHKAYVSLAEWIVRNLLVADEISTFLTFPIGRQIERCLNTLDWYIDA